MNEEMFRLQAADARNRIFGLENLVEELRQQIKRWEDKEVARATGCCGQEERAIAAEAEVARLKRRDEILLQMGRRVVKLWQDGKARIAELEGDVEAAAEECLVPLPAPGTDMARVVIANRQLRQRVAELEKGCDEDRRTIEELVTAEHAADAAIDAFVIRVHELKKERDEARKSVAVLQAAHSSSLAAGVKTGQLWQAAKSRCKALEETLRKATIRLEILGDRMRACDEGENVDVGHELSLFEIGGWVEEQRAALSADKKEKDRETPET